MPPHVQENAIFTIFYNFRRFWTIFVHFDPQKHKYFENCGWKTFITSDTNFIHKLSKISEVEKPP